jgi:hypothetical protein
MKETKFKTLMHCGEYVDANLLEKGIYTSNKPYIYSQNETIENLIEKGKQMIDITGNCFISDNYFQNLNECKLVDVLITETYI